MDIHEVVGKNIRKLREAMGYSQEELANKAGLKRSYFGHIERGDRNVTLTALNQIAVALKVHPSVLMLSNAFEYDGTSKVRVPPQ